MKIRILLVIVILYILAAFGWWLYSLVNLAQNTYMLEVEKLSLQCIKEREALMEVAKKEFQKNGGSIVQPVRVLDFIDTGVLKEAHKAYRSKTILSINRNAGSIENLVQLIPDPGQLKAYRQKFDSRKNAFFSEAIFFTLAVVIGVVWVFRKLESILNLNRQQNNFLLSVTHELKTPVAAVKLVSETLQKRELDADTRKRLLGQAVSNADRLTDLIDNMLLATRIDGNNYNFINEPVHLCDLVEQLADDVRADEHFSGSINVSIPEDLFVPGDGMALQLAFSNLIQNAVKYGPPDVKIDISAVEEDNKIYMVFADNGQGIPKHEWSRVFEKFYRVGDEQTRKTKGTGLGLYLVKQILSQHNAIIYPRHNQPTGIMFNIVFKL